MEIQKGRGWLQAVPPGVRVSAGCIPCGFILLYPAKEWGRKSGIPVLCEEGFGFESRCVAPPVKRKSEFRVGKT